MYLVVINSIPEVVLVNKELVVSRGESVGVGAVVVLNARAIAGVQRRPERIVNRSSIIVAMSVEQTR